MDALEPRTLLAMIQVTSTADTLVADDVMTLREAILVANGERDPATELSQAERDLIDGPLETVAPDLIVFSLSGDLPHVIRPTSGLPTVKQPTTIDAAYGLSGFSEPEVEIDGSLIPYVPSTDPETMHYAGLFFRAGNSTLRGVSIHGFGTSQYSAGVMFATAQGDTIQSCWVGLRPDGSVQPANPQEIGVLVMGTGGHTIGGTDWWQRNVISGQMANIKIMSIDPAEPQTVVQGNYVGTDPTGTAPRGGANGIWLRNARNVLIGGEEAGAGNVVSGNGGAGIVVEADRDGYGSGVVVQGNRIGTDRTGLAAIGNEAGIMILSSRAQIGGTAPGAGNVISGNGVGIEIAGLMIEGVLPVSQVAVQGNRIGVSVDGQPLGNTHGVRVGPYAHDCMIGGTEPGSGNQIAYNTGGNAGIVVVQALQERTRNGAPTTPEETYGISILGNWIHDNAGLGIDLGDDGLTPNDPEDLDTGANTLQNAPELISATRGSLTVSGRLQLHLEAMFRIEFFGNETADESGYGEGRYFLGALDLAPSDVVTAFTFTYTGELPESVRYVTATATDVFGNTSEFSNAIAIRSVGNLPPVFTPETLSLTTPEGTRLVIDPLEGATDPEGDPLALANLDTTETRGTVTTDEGGRLAYTPPAGYLGEDRFRYTIRDAAQNEVSRLVVIHVTDATPPTVVALRRRGIHGQPTRLILTFSEPLDPTRARDVGRYRLVDSGRDGRLGTPDDVVVRIAAAAYDAGSRTVTLRPRTRLYFFRPFRLTIDGSSATPMTDAAGNPLDGDRDGLKGGDAVLTFQGYDVIPQGATRLFRTTRARRRP